MQISRSLKLFLFIFVRKKSQKKKMGEKKKKCPVDGCNSEGNKNPKFNSHRSRNSCPYVEKNKASIEEKSNNNKTSSNMLDNWAADRDSLKIIK